MPIRTETEDSKRRKPINKLPLPPLPMLPFDGKPVLLPKQHAKESSPSSQLMRLTNNVSPHLSNATAQLSLNTTIHDRTTTTGNTSNTLSSSSSHTRSNVHSTQTRKAVHLASEKKRRQNISDGFSDLRTAISNACLPSNSGAIILSNDSKAAILRKAAIAINEQTEEIKRMRLQFYGKSGPPPSPKMVTLISSVKGGGEEGEQVRLALRWMTMM